MSGPGNTFRVFSADDVRNALPMADAVEAMKGAFRELSAGEATVPLRTHITMHNPEADALVMSCYSPRLERGGVKFLTLHPDNASKGLPFIQATVMIVDAENGTPLAVMNGGALTAIRTGAASGAATDVLARKDASRVAIFGSGIQAATQLEAVCAVREIKAAVVFDVDPARAAAYAERMGKKLGIEIAPVTTATEALRGADIVCTATTSKSPVFEDSDVEAGTHINAIGVYKPHEREIPAQTVARAFVVVDEREAAWEESGELVLARDEGLIDESHVKAELGEIVAGIKGGRVSAEQVTLFKSVGVANQDLAAAQAVLVRGAQLGLGTEVRL